jgi:hypothetical protein
MPPFGPWPGVPGGGGGGVDSVSVIAPITDSGSPADPDIGLAFDGASLVTTAGVLERGALGKDVSAAAGSNSVDVIAIEETSGPTRLAINAIPDEGAGNNAVLVRPGGTGTVVGVPVSSLVSVAVTAPITNSGTAQNPDIGLAFDGSSLVTSAGILERGALGKDVSAVVGSNSVDVIAIEETSGPSRLAINAIPDTGAGFFSILTRPGGTGTVVGETNADLSLPKLMITYHVSLPAATLFVGGWVFPGTFASLASVKVEALLPSRGLKTRVTANVERNNLSAGADLTVDMSRNGSSTAPNTSLLIPAGSIGLFDSGLITPTTAANDTWGLEIDQPIQFATGSIDATITIFVY